MESEEQQRHSCYSIQLRLRRVTTEYCYINVPLTNDLVIPQSDGTGRIDPDRMVEQAKELSRSGGVKWYVEGQELEPHPIQKPMEPGEEKFQGPFPPSLHPLFSACANSWALA
jgi:hypothetical protein